MEKYDSLTTFEGSAKNSFEYAKQLAGKRMMSKTLENTHYHTHYNENNKVGREVKVCVKVTLILTMNKEKKNEKIH